MIDFLEPCDLNRGTQEDKIAIERKKPVHVPPHLHDAVEMIYVTSGTVELGVGEELYHMEKGDFAVVFPNVIHHYQVFGNGKNEGIYIFMDPAMLPSYYDDLQKFSPQYPIIGRKSLPVDIVNAIKVLMDANCDNRMLVQAYAQVILAHIFSIMKMTEKEYVGGNDIIYKAVEYVAKNFSGEISLDKMAYDLGVSKYVLSRMFAKTFHCNFNQYVNGVRLNYATAYLKDIHEPITNICLDCGFESQRTFNRVFKEKYKMSPREYRKRIRVVNT